MATSLNQQITKPPTVTKPTSARLIGPFSLEPSGIGGHIIIGGNGAKLVWVYSEDAAQKILRLMNVADRHGYFG